MYACIIGEDARDLAAEFSPRIEETAPGTVGTVILDITGLERLFGSSREIAERLARTGARVAVAANPDAALHAARGFPGVTVLELGKEADALASLPVELLSPADAMLEILDRWGIHTFGDLAGLPPLGVAERLGPEGVRLYQLARGQVTRPLRTAEPEPAFEEVLDLEHPIELLEPLAFVLSRMLDDLCRRLEARALAAQELRLLLRLDDGSDHARALRLPLPMLAPRAFLKLLYLDLSAHPPGAPILKVTLAVQPARPRPQQGGLYEPTAPRPEKLEVILARLAGLVGEDHVGSPELLDTHRPDAFRMVRFGVGSTVAAPRPARRTLAFRVFRPAFKIRVRLNGGQPAQIAGHGKITAAAGPWRSSGDWWTTDPWDRDEWDVAVADKLFRIYHEREEWFLQGVYD